MLLIIDIDIIIIIIIIIIIAELSNGSKMENSKKQNNLYQIITCDNILQFHKVKNNNNKYNKSDLQSSDCYIYYINSFYEKISFWVGNNYNNNNQLLAFLHEFILNYNNNENVQVEVVSEGFESISFTSEFSFWIGYYYYYYCYYYYYSTNIYIFS